MMVMSGPVMDVLSQVALVLSIGVIAAAFCVVGLLVWAAGRAPCFGDEAGCGLPAFFDRLD